MRWPTLRALTLALALGLGPSALAAPDSAALAQAAGSYLAGRAAVDAGDFRSAAQEFEAALLVEPDNLELRRQLFGLLLASGELERAAAAGRELSGRGATGHELELVLGIEAAHDGRWEEAAARLETMGRDGLAGPVQPILLAWARYAGGARAEAIASLDTGTADSGIARLSAYHRAAMLGLDDRAAEGVAVLDAAFTDPAGAPTRVLRGAVALRLAAGDRAGAERLVAAARAADRDDLELARLEAAAAGDVTIAPVRDPSTGMADALVSLAEALLEQDRTLEAMQLARAAAHIAPDDPESPLLIARVALELGSPGEALRVLEQVPRDASIAWSADLVRARAYQEQEDIDAAVALLEQMAERAPGRADPLIAMGDLLRGKDRFAEAEQAYSRALERVAAIERRHWRLLYARGITYERTKRWPEAEADLLKALELEPEQPYVLNYLGYSWVDQGLHLDRAKGMLHRAVELRPDDGFIVDSLGWAYYRLGEHEKAVTYLERAVELEPGDPVINDHLGDAYWRVGRQREARYQWQRALTFEPEAEAVPAIQRKLAEGLSDAQPAPG